MNEGVNSKHKLRGSHEFADDRVFMYPGPLAFGVVVCVTITHV